MLGSDRDRGNSPLSTGGGAEWTYENEPVVNTMHAGLGPLSHKLLRKEQPAALLRYNHIL